MDFNDTAQEAAFRAEAKAWLEANVPSRNELEGLDEIPAAKLWQKRKYDAGWACIRWPAEYGGRGASAIEQVIWNQEEGKFPVPGGVFGIGQGMAAPTLMAWAKEEHKRKHLPPLASGEHIWCQLFSEPAGGSDLAALRTRAQRDGDEWVINGQKIWTSGAHYSDYGIIVLRTDPNVPKHKGLSYFFLDMKSPGIDIRPIKQISGGANFNEVYFTDVRVPDDQRLGAVGQGWQVALTTLMNERMAIGGGGGGVGFRQVFDLARKVEIDGEPAIRDKNVRAKLATWYTQEAGLRFTGYRSMTALSKGATPGTGKLHRQAGCGFQDPGHGLLRHGSARAIRRGLGPRLRRSPRCLPSHVHGLARLANRGRQRRNHAQHPVGTGIGNAAGCPRRQGDSVQRGTDRALGGPGFGIRDLDIRLAS